MSGGLAAGFAMRQLIGPIVVALTLMSSVGARAETEEQDSAEKRAAALHRQGQKHYREGDYEEAIVAFEQAYRFAQLPGILFNLAQAHRMLGECREAARYYRFFLEAGAETPQGGTAREHLEATEACARERAARAPSDPSPTDSSDEETDDSEGESSPPSPRESTAPVAPHPAKGREAVRGDQGRGMRVSGLALAGGGVAALAGGVIAGLSARSANSDLLAYLGQNGGVFDSSAQRLESTFYRRRRWSIGLVATGAAMTAAGGLLFVLAPREERGGAGQLSLMPNEGGAMLLWSRDLR